MWLLINEKLNDEFFLLQIGKALCLCQKFESTCKEITMWFGTMKSLKEKKYDFLDNKYKDNVDKLLNLFLVKSINLLKKNYLLKIKESDLQILQNARKSRNFIVHDSTDILISESFNPSLIIESRLDIKIFKNHIKKIAEGDFLVSKWSYEFHEKESGAFYKKGIYIEKIMKWIFK
jgi:hypothetical protein